MAYHETIKDATSYDELLGGSEIPVLTKNVALKQGKVYRRGMLLTAKTDSGTGNEQSGIQGGISELGHATADGRDVLDRV